MEEIISTVKQFSRTETTKIFLFAKTINFRNINFEFVAQGAEGIVYKSGDIAIKFYKNTLVNQHKNELTFIKLANKLIDKNISNNFVKLYDATKLFGLNVLFLELVTGDMEIWMQNKHSDIEWLQMLFQLLCGIMIIQNCMLMYHADLKPKNILYKTYEKPKLIKYIIDDKEFTITTNTIFKISDFGGAVTLLPNFINRIPQPAIKLSIENNLDLKHLAMLHIRLLSMMIIQTYTLEEIINFGKSSDHFNDYVIKATKGVEENRRKFKHPKEFANKRLAMALSYYLVEHKYFNVDDLSNYSGTVNYLPSKTIINMFISLSYVKGRGSLLKKIIEIGNLINEKLTKCDEIYILKCDI